MKKIIILMGIIILTSSMAAYAGDIPESLLYSDEAQLFFGEVLSYHPNKEKPDIEVSPVKTIKGDIKEGTKQIYYNPDTMGNFQIKEGNIYLFTYYNGANQIDIFEVTTYDTKTLKLKHVSGDMWERFEKYLNEGKYGDAAIEVSVNPMENIVYMATAVVVLVGIVGFIIRYRL